MDRNKPVDSPEFWKQRLNQALSEGAIERSVYRCPKQEWDNINAAHFYTVRQVLGQYKDVAKILDAGCGYGRSCCFFNPQQYTGVDFSPDLIAEAKKKFPEYRFDIGDVTNLWYEDGEFDYVFCTSLMIMIIQNLGWFKWEEIQNELLRVSKYGIICLEYGCGDTNTDYNTYYMIKKNGT